MVNFGRSECFAGPLKTDELWIRRVDRRLPICVRFAQCPGREQIDGSRPAYDRSSGGRGQSHYSPVPPRPPDRFTRVAAATSDKPWCRRRP